MSTLTVRIRHRPTGLFISKRLRWSAFSRSDEARSLVVERNAHVVTNISSLRGACTNFVRHASNYDRTLTWADGDWSQWEAVHASGFVQPLREFLTLPAAPTHCHCECSSGSVCKDCGLPYATDN